MADTEKMIACTGDCKKCNIYQRGYCSSQIAYNNMNMLAGVQKSMDSLSERMARLEEKLEHSEAELIIPNSAEGEAAQKVGSRNNQKLQNDEL